MPNTYYKYAERQADSYVNWAEIGKDMTDMLSETVRVREEKKDAIDKASRDFQEKLNNVPQGEDASARKAALIYADNASKFMLMQDRLLKSGQLKLKDYTVARQNILDGTDRAFGAMADYQKVYGEKMQRYRDGKSSLGEVLNMGEAEGYGNWAKSGFYINPTNGQVVIAKMDKQVVDGKEIYAMSQNPSEVASVAEVQGLIQGQWDKYDVTSATDAWAKSLGKDITAVRTKDGTLVSTGEIKSKDDITNRTDIDEATKQVMYKFLDAENKWIDSTLVNDYDQASVLLDQIGAADVNGEKKPYYFTTDPNIAKTDNAAILKVIDPSTQRVNYQFNEDQQKQSRELVRAIARSKYNKEVKLESIAQLRDETYHPPQPTGTTVEIDEKLKAAKNFAQNMVYSMTGDATTSGEGTRYLGAQAKVGLNKTKDSYVVTDKDGKTQTYKFNADGTIADPLKFAKSFIGAVNTMGLNETDVLRYFQELLPKGAGMNLTTEASAYDVEKTPPDPFKAYGQTAGSLIGTVNTDEEKAYQELNASLGAIGAKVRIPFTYGDFIVVKAPNGKESTEIDLKNPVKAKAAIVNWLKANPKGKTPEEQKAWIKSLQGTGIIGGGELD